MYVGLGDPHVVVVTVSLIQGGQVIREGRRQWGVDALGRPDPGTRVKVREATS